MSVARRAGPDPPLRGLKALWRALRTDRMGGQWWLVGGMLVHAAAVGGVWQFARDPGLGRRALVDLAVGVVAAAASVAFWWHFVRLWLVMRGGQRDG